ncbi:MAG TPA: hypothetical protein VGO67_01060 [Verrucomicrobiae bacterium]|jgi:hypothetical protein
MASIQEHLSRLEGDQWRLAHPFSEDIKTACDVLLNPFARDDERKRAVRGWLTKNQPCVFGQVAAKSDLLFISIVDEQLISQGDEVVREKLKLDRQTWKQWSLGEKGRHGFLLVVLSPKIHHAAPNRALKDLAQQVRNLFAEDVKPDPVGNDMVYEWLYLKNLQTGQFHKFRVILDFFASAADQRWWHDHRFPGGIAFTFNSLGHMARTKEWYEKNATPTEWAAKLAMHTIASAFPHSVHGSATALLELNNGASRKSMACPFRSLQALPEKIKGKDWTTYAGYHHTDHSIRGEFFDGRENPDRSRGPYFLDFSYIAGGDGGENRELMDGIVVEQAFLDSDLGPVEEWRFAKPLTKVPLVGEEETPISADAVRTPHRPVEEDQKIRRALAVCDEWLQSEIIH